jgi:YHS domain-containing protein
MDIEITSAAGRSDHDGMTYYFCSMGCKREFDTDPAGSLQREGEYDHSKGVDHAMMGGDSPHKKAWWQFWKK